MKQFIQFTVAGAIAATANWTARLFLDNYFSLTFSIVFAYTIGMLTAYCLNRTVVFNSTAPIALESLYFILVNIISLIQVLSITLFLNSVLFPAINFSWNPTEISHAIGIMSPIIVSFWLHKRYTFNDAFNTNRDSE